MPLASNKKEASNELEIAFKSGFQKEASNEAKSYYMTEQYIPTRGKSIAAYEVGPEDKVNRFVTYMPKEDKVEKVNVDWNMELGRDARGIDKNKFKNYWKK